jgi:hypothetical protein
MSAATLQADVTTWQGDNQLALSAALSALQETWGSRSDGVNGNLAVAMNSPPALETICSLFNLSTFERAVLLVCAGLELDASFAKAWVRTQAGSQNGEVTFGKALSTLQEPHWSALGPHAPLRFWRLIEFVDNGVPSAPLTTRALRIDERILHYLAGVPGLDERLAGIVQPAAPAQQLTETQEGIAKRAAAAWECLSPSPVRPVIQLHGSDSETIQHIASRACARLGLDLYTITQSAVPLAFHEQRSLLRIWEREAALTSAALLLECDSSQELDPARTGALTNFIEAAKFPLIISCRERLPFIRRKTVALEVTLPTNEEQRSLWQTALGELSRTLDGKLDMLTSQFNLSPAVIHSAAAQATPGSPQELLFETLWNTCRSRASVRMDDLAQRIESSAEWADLILPSLQKQTLYEIVTQVRQRDKVYRRWAFGEKHARGLGISALFAGTSGTGKTMAAEVLARELRLDLYRVDLSSVISKYIGETEKNLRRIFDAAEQGGVILLFDEADAIFGKRSEVKDSRDRYANLEVSYLLQRMECYRGLAVLTTNMKSALDSAFLRRIRFVVQFPFPDCVQRAEIWRRALPSSAPTRALDMDRLAQLNIAGGNIRNIALNSAFLAAGEGAPVSMSHILRAARSEYSKLDRTLTDAEIYGWQQAAADA